MLVKDAEGARFPGSWNSAGEMLDGARESRAVVEVPDLTMA